MDGAHLLFDLPPQIGPQSSRGVTRRPQPIRNSILAYLQQPRTVTEIAAHIDRRTCVVTGHLRAMRLRGLVVRLAWGVWLCRDLCTGAPDHSTIRRPKSTQDLLPEIVREPEPKAIRHASKREPRRVRK